MNVGVYVMALLVAVASNAAAQDQRGSIRVSVRSGTAAVTEASVTIGSASGQTDATGSVILAVPVGPTEIVVSKEHFVTAREPIEIVAGREQVVTITLEPEPTVEEEVTVVATTRTGRRLEDQPTRVEVLGREEIEEKMLMTPGDIVMMLNEMGGMRVQATSPSIGAASIRVQGMQGRYTRLLSDGLPLFGLQVSGLGLLQIPPMDLGQVEVIKGVASAMYGAGAMGGVINLISRRPSEDGLRELLVNRSTLGATDAVAFLASPTRAGWSSSLLAGGHWQTKNDVDDDGWLDLAGYARGVVRPRVFWNGSDGRSAFLTAGATYEDREGGTASGMTVPQIGRPYVEALDTRRYDVGGTAQTPWRDRYVLTARAAAAWQRRDHRFDDALERDDRDTAFVELSGRAAMGRHVWVAGLAYERDAFRPDDTPQFGYTYDVPGVFVQDDMDLAPWISISASGRLDVHSKYGTFFSPRISALFRKDGWTSRIAVGQGFFAPTPLTEETEAAGLSRLQIPLPLDAERGRSVSVDVTRTAGIGTYTVTIFGSRVSDPVSVELDEQRYALVNLVDASTNVGMEVLATLRHEPFVATATYTYVRARETDESGRVDVDLTPRHSAGIVGMWEREGVARLGIECYYTGAQRLENNPYRSRSKPYVIIGALAERRIGRVRVFINAENLTDVRQTRWDPLVRPDRAADGRWTVDGWAPLDGRVFNGGVRLDF